MTSKTESKAEKRERILTELETGTTGAKIPPCDAFMNVDTIPPNSIIRSYVRVSTNFQYINGVSVENQMQTLREKSEEAKCKTMILYSDVAKSGQKTETRKGLTTMLREVKQGDVVMVYSLDRLVRDDVACDTILSFLAGEGVPLVALDVKASPDKMMSMMQYNIKKTMAKAEVLQTSDRIKKVLKREKANGTLRRRVPFGKKCQGKGLPLIDHPDEVKTLSIIHDLCFDAKTNQINPNITNEYICDELIRQGRKMKSGKMTWPNSTVRIIRAQQGWFPSDKPIKPSIVKIRKAYLDMEKTEKKRDLLGRNQKTEEKKQ